MKQIDKVVWTEGMFLTPHLFQQSDRYHENLLDFRLKPLGPFYWGLTELEIDHEVLPKGEFTILRCSGVLPDGLPIQIPDTDEPPESRSFKAHFPPTLDKLDLFLAIPINRSGSLNFQLRDGLGGRPLRYGTTPTRHAPA